MSEMRTEFTVEEWLRLSELTGQWPPTPDAEHSGKPSLAAVEAECHERLSCGLHVHCCKRTGAWVYEIWSDSGGVRTLYDLCASPDRPAALVELVEAIYKKEAAHE